MTRTVKKTYIFFLFLAAVLLNAHMIIPHDHHAADSDARQEGSCPVSQNGAGHHSGFPVHCHAFNDLTSERAVINFIIKQVKCRDLVQGSVTYNAVSDIRISWLTVFAVFAPPVNSGLPELSSLRAPPSIS